MYFNNLRDIIELNKRSGYSTFSDGVMTYFETRLYPKIYGGCYFIKSDLINFPANPERVYTICRAWEDGKVTEVGLTAGYKSLKEAEQFLVQNYILEER